VSPRACELHAFVGQRAQILAFERERRPSGLAGVQDLFDRLHQPLAVFKHHAVELMRRSSLIDSPRARSVSR
jgi:hypothetical protein